MSLSRLRSALLAFVFVASVPGARATPAVPQALPEADPHPALDSERGAFAVCHGAHRVTCIVDGDTIWYRGEKIRIADINAPELGHPACRYEALLAQAATERLAALLNAGTFSLAPWPGRRIDRYGRSLYVIERDGRSIGMELVHEGLAERWKGYRGNWC
jgi:endonuclease YncB( thermonuclease family)